MSHSDDTTDQGRERTAAGERRDTAQSSDRPDQRGPRGNQEVETVDVERGEGKIERVLGW